MESSGGSSGYEDTVHYTPYNHRVSRVEMMMTMMMMNNDVLHIFSLTVILASEIC